MKKFLHWLVLSSQDPQKLSLTLKGILVMYSPVIVFTLGVLKLPLDQSALSQIIDAAVFVVQSVLVLVGASVALVGIVQKVVLSVTGHNQVIENALPVSQPSSLVQFNVPQ